MPDRGQVQYEPVAGTPLRCAAGRLCEPPPQFGGKHVVHAVRTPLDKDKPRAGEGQGFVSAVEGAEQAYGSQNRAAEQDEVSVYVLRID